MKYKCVKLYRRSYDKLTTAKDELEGLDYYLCRARIVELAIDNLLKSIIKMNVMKHGI